LAGSGANYDGLLGQETMEVLEPAEKLETVGGYLLIAEPAANLEDFVDFLFLMIQVLLIAGIVSKYEFIIRAGWLPTLLLGMF
jgi:hypothetical protein